MYPVEINKNGEGYHRDSFEKQESQQMNLFSNVDGCFYPRTEHFVSAIKQKGIFSVVVCEALNSQEQGAILMKKLYDGV